MLPLLGGMGHAPKDITANQHPHYGRLAHEEGCGGARTSQVNVISCAKMQNSANLGQVEATLNGSLGNSGDKEEFHGSPGCF